jgi:LmbE family N-acetylglucosaminyl deacetylase
MSFGDRGLHREAVLAVGAHPDDVNIGCAGSLMRHAARGDTVTVLTLTGAGEQPGTCSCSGSSAGAEFLGVRLVHHDLLPAELGDGSRSVPLIEDLIEEIGATTVYTHGLNDIDPEHRHVHRATMLAARQVPRIYCYQTRFAHTRYAAPLEIVRESSPDRRSGRPLRQDQRDHRRAARLALDIGSTAQQAHALVHP